MSLFQIDADNFTWIDGTSDDIDDLCLHGHVTLRIGDEIFEDDGTVSATALYLLKSLEENKLISRETIQMIPCCGHFYIAAADLSEVTILGCDKGTDFAIEHEGGLVKITSESGTVIRISLEEYRKEVCRFADKIEAFYASCTPKNLPEDEFTRNGYLAFWTEWHRRRGKTAEKTV